MKLRIATFNLENLDEEPGKKPTLQERIAVLEPQLERLNADIFCFQEVNGQGEPTTLSALNRLLSGTPYSSYKIASTLTTQNDVFKKRNLVIASRFDISNLDQVNHEYIPSPKYRKVTANPTEDEAKEIHWERPLLYGKVEIKDNFHVHLINLHLKSRRPVGIKGQYNYDEYKWESSSGWAEGYFISSMKRVGQALETRIFLDSIFDNDNEAIIVVCGDFNAHPGEVPIETICGRIENNSNPDLIGRVMIPCEETIPESKRYTFLYHGQKNLLDHMLISRSMLTYYHDSEIHNEMLHDETLSFALDTKFPESDHAPFVAEFVIPD